MALINLTWLARNFDKANARLTVYGKTYAVEDALLSIEMPLITQYITPGTPLESVIQKLMNQFFTYLPARVSEIRILEDLPGMLTLGLFLRGSDTRLMEYTLVDDVARYLFHCGWEVSVSGEVLEQADVRYRQLTQQQNVEHAPS
ncbi:hypothetical protein WCE16_06750 [Atlantibacter hermannii]